MRLETAVSTTTAAIGPDRHMKLKYKSRDGGCRHLPHDRKPAQRRERRSTDSPVEEVRESEATLTPLRWLAVVGQVTATAVAALVLKLHVPVGPIAAVVVLTAVSNLIITSWMKLGRAAGMGWCRRLCCSTSGCSRRCSISPAGRAIRLPPSIWFTWRWR